MRARKDSNIDLRSFQKRYVRALLDGDWVAANGIVNEASTRMTMLDVYFRILAPAMRQIGELWCEGKINVAQEHLATQITLGQMDRLKLMQSVPRPLSYRVIVSCVEGEQHFVAARMIADLLQIEGWWVDFLGPDVPSRALLEMVNARRPKLLALSITLASNLRQARLLLKQLRKLPDAPNIIVGGQAALSNRAQKGNFECIETAPSIIEGLTFAKKLLVPYRSKATLADYLEALGRSIRDLRQKAGWTQQQLAQATRLTRAYIVSVEGGKQNVSIDVVIRVANALGVAPEHLLAKSEAPK